MILLVTVLHIIVCLFLIIVVLLQSGKAADLAGAFGGMGSQTAFGPRGSATVLSKATTIAAALFMVTSLTLSILHTRAGGTGGGASVLERTKLPTSQAPAPAMPPSPAPAVPGKGVPPGAPVPIQLGKPGEPVAPGQPSVTLSTEGGKQLGTVPLKIGKQPSTTQQPATQTQPPAAPPKK